MKLKVTGGNGMCGIHKDYYQAPQMTKDDYYLGDPPKGDEELLIASLVAGVLGSVTAVAALMP
jgi:hypothetical protein